MNTIGIDISKDKFDVAWLRHREVGKVKNKHITNTAKGHTALIDWAMKQTQQPIVPIHFVMEATGIYHEALAYALFNDGARISVVNPAQIKHYAKSLGTRSKTDNKDGKTLVRFGATQQPVCGSLKPMKFALSGH